MLQNKLQSGESTIKTVKKDFTPNIIFSEDFSANSLQKYLAKNDGQKITIRAFQNVPEAYFAQENWQRPCFGVRGSNSCLNLIIHGLLISISRFSVFEWSKEKILLFFKKNRFLIISDKHLTCNKFFFSKNQINDTIACSSHHNFLHTQSRQVLL